MRRTHLLILLAALAAACGPPVQRDGVLRHESETFTAAAARAEACYAAAAGVHRNLPRELEVVTVYAGEGACRLEAVACARADFNVVYLVDGQYQRNPEAALAHELMHVLLYPEMGLDGEAQHQWLELATTNHSEACAGIPARRMSELEP